ncbi:MAG TPA: ABC transporter substrate-binding protein, partial [Cyanothece sp. UBA12306]|nr:ABC transporter substrate-binding protein [Cyanothece sp. UBA12306]
FVSFEGFLNAKLMAEILKRLMTSSEDHNLHHIVDNLNDFDLGIGIPLKFGEDGHQGLHKIYYSTVKNNQIFLLKDVK